MTKDFSCLLEVFLSAFQIAACDVCSIEVNHAEDHVRSPLTIRLSQILGQVQRARAVLSCLVMATVSHFAASHHVQFICRIIFLFLSEMKQYDSRLFFERIQAHISHQVLPFH